MVQKIKVLSTIPPKLAEINDPPKKLYIEGDLPTNPELKYVAVVGSRNFTTYGKMACEKIIAGLAGYPIVIISGLALGIDAIAHHAALKNGLLTIAMPGSGISEKVISPRTNFVLSREILKKGGCILSEMEPDMQAAIWSFPRRNRLMAGLADAVLLIEAKEKSGTLITARLAMEYNRDVLVVPGEIFSETSIGTNKLIKEGAHPCLGAKEVLEILGFKEQEVTGKLYDNCTPEEIAVLDMLYEPMPKELLMQKYPGSATDLNMYLSLLEIKGHIKETMGEIRKV
jgi:DNA processing protein